MTYQSKNRIVMKPSSHLDGIIQPPPPNIVKQMQQEAEQPKETNQLDQIVASAANWLYANNWPIIPEITTVPNLTPVKDLAVVVGHTGVDSARYRANAQALTRIMRANPAPKHFIFVEFINPGEVSHYKHLEDMGWDKVIVVNTTEKGKNVWQKEAIWTVGAKYAFSLPGITKCVFLDADMAYHDNSWCHYISQSLETYPIIQSFEGFYYAEQPDCTSNYYGPRHIAVSTAWAAAHGAKTGVPGGSYACTKDFFENVLNNHWPYSSRGSGDAVLWLFLKGLANTREFPMHSDFRLSNKIGAFTHTKVGYAPLLAMHFNHGPLSNRMYGSRDYLLRKSNTYPGSDIAPNEDGVLEWTDTYEGRFMQKATNILFELNKKVQVNHRTLLSEEIKAATRTLRQDTYGKISEQNPLYIVSYADDSVSNEQILKLATSVRMNCQTSCNFVILSNREIPGVTCCPYPTLPLHLCTGAWKRLIVFNLACGENASVLFIDPKVTIKSRFMLNQCPDKHIYMARPFVLAKSFGHCNWDSSIMFFRNIKGLYEQYKKDLNAGRDRHPEYQFFDPSDFINAYAHFNGYTCRNISTHLDYAYEKQDYYATGVRLAEFILPDE